MTRSTGRNADPTFRSERARKAAAAAHAARAKIEYHVGAIEARAGELTSEQATRLRRAAAAAGGATS
jgi:hypothetical protein